MTSTPDCQLDLQPGDRIIAADGVPVLEDVVVVESDQAGPDRAVVRAAWRAEPFMIYLDSHEYGIRRPEPAARKPRQRVTVGGVSLALAPDGSWATLDGRYQVGQQPWVHECERPHPVRITDGLAKDVRERPNAYGFDSLWRAVGEGRKHYLCPGEQNHPQWLWYVWDTQLDDYVDRDPAPVATLREAVAMLPDEYRKR